MTPTLTAVVATYNNRAILERCLASWERHAGGLPVEVVVHYRFVLKADWDETSFVVRATYTIESECVRQATKS